MDLGFEQGRRDQPRGHAVLYFRSPSGLLATYMVVLPISMDITKYIPPFLASQVKATGVEDFSAFAMPPIPEDVEGYRYLEELARDRGDDLVYGGDLLSTDVLQAAQEVNEAVQAYAELYNRQRPAPSGAKEEPEAVEELAVDQVLYSLMSERDKLAEVAKLMGALRFAVEGGDEQQKEEAKKEMLAVGRHLPEGFRIPRLVEVAELTIEKGQRLAELYLQRCYKLCDEDYTSLQDIEEQIQELERPPAQA